MKFSNKSKEQLNTCHSSLIKLMNEAISRTKVDFSIIQGARTVEEAQDNYNRGVSTLDPSKGQYSKHIAPLPDGSREKSIAVDICPYVNGGLAWNDVKAFGYLGGLIEAIAQELSISIRWGGNWDGDGDLHDNSLEDAGHFELN